MLKNFQDFKPSHFFRVERGEDNFTSYTWNNSSYSKNFALLWIRYIRMIMYQINYKNIRFKLLQHKGSS